MNTERNCQSCKYYKDGYCENLELKPCYPQKGCDDFSKRNELKKDTVQVLDKIISEATSLKISYTDHDKDTYRRGVNDVVKIIDKYREGKG